MKKIGLFLMALLFLTIIILNIVYNKNIFTNYIIGIFNGIALGKTLANLIHK